VIRKDLDGLDMLNAKMIPIGPKCCTLKAGVREGTPEKDMMAWGMWTVFVCAESMHRFRINTTTIPI